jgi:peptide/bleomycin uptake transporter
MLQAFFGSRKWLLWAWGGLFLLIVLLYAQVQLAVLLNIWREGFGDMLQDARKRDVAEFWQKLTAFAEIVAPLVALSALTNFFARHYAFRWRQSVTFDYLPRWIYVARNIEGASQRIQEDTSRFAKTVESLGMEAVRSFMNLVAFGPILWDLSVKVELPIIKDIPGSLFWIALATSFGGTAISWLVGWMLPGLEYANQRAEAAFRKKLVLAEDEMGVHGHMPSFIELFTGIRTNYFRLFLHYGYFDLWGRTYSQIMIFAPYIAMGPGLFTGIITLGVLNRVASAFDDVHSGFSMFVNNWTTITELRSIWKRLHEFEAHIGATS